MDKTQIRAIALNAAAVRFAGLQIHQSDTTDLLEWAKQFEDYLNGKDVSQSG